jgi:hypothetical protein
MSSMQNTYLLQIILLVFIFSSGVKSFPVKSGNTQKQPYGNYYRSLRDETNDSLKCRVFSCRNVKTDTMVFTGEAVYNKITSGRSGEQFWIRSENFYIVSLYLREKDIIKITKQAKNDSLKSFISGEKVHQDIIFSEFPKAVVLNFRNTCPAIKIREDFATNIRDFISLNGIDVKMFLNYINMVKQKFEDGDEIILYFSGNGRISTIVDSQELPFIENKKLAHTILGIWVGKEKLSGMNPGLLTEVGLFLNR